MTELVDDGEPVLDTSRDEMLRREAERKGATTYFTGEPCVWGHVAARYTSNSRCIKCRDMATARRAENEGRKYKPRGQQLKRNTSTTHGIALGKSNAKHEWWLQG